MKKREARNCDNGTGIETIDQGMRRVVLDRGRVSVMVVSGYLLPRLRGAAV